MGVANLDTHRGKAMCRDRGERHPSTSQKERPGKHRSFIILRRNQCHWHLDVLFPASRNLRINLCCLSHSVCCILSWKPYQTNTLTMNVDKTIKKLIISSLLQISYFQPRLLGLSLWFYTHSHSPEFLFISPQWPYSHCLLEHQTSASSLRLSHMIWP